MDDWKKRKTDRCMDASIEKQNEEHNDEYLWTWIKRWTGPKKINKEK
jgi:hypothetical protein